VTRIDVEPLARTLPYRWYADASVAEAERDAIFRRTWQYAGHLGELDGPGSLFPTHAGGVPVVVTLDRDGALRAFVNVCRHRGAATSSRASSATGWGCSRSPSTRGGRSSSSTPDPDAEPLAAALGDLPAVVAEHGLDIGALRHHRRVSYELRANWKVAIENYLECYHCAINHPGFVDAVDERALRVEGAPPRLSQFAPCTRAR
jgi:phenylpropionate dioxygenase-like ring-hydroxylating dioxygenase large terminal subunit